MNALVNSYYQNNTQYTLISKILSFWTHRHQEIPLVTLKMVRISYGPLFFAYLRRVLNHFFYVSGLWGRGLRSFISVTLNSLHSAPRNSSAPVCWAPCARHSTQRAPSVLWDSSFLCPQQPHTCTDDSAVWLWKSAQARPQMRGLLPCTELLFLASPIHTCGQEKWMRSQTVAKYENRGGLILKFLKIFLCQTQRARVHHWPVA